jgi:hypothetical protein
VRSPKRSSADAWKLASTVTVDVLMAFFSVSFFTGAADDVDAPAGVEAPLPGAGVPTRLGSALTVRSFPWVSMMALGNVANFVSSAVGKRVLANANKALTSVDDWVVRLQLYCGVERVCHRTSKA